MVAYCYILYLNILNSMYYTLVNVGHFYFLPKDKVHTFMKVA